jgi:hypothetical protein
MKTKILLLCAILLAGISCKKDKPLTAPQAGLISYFNFDDNLKDQKGYTNDGVKTGAPSYLTGVIGKAIHFNGTDQKIVFTPKIPVVNTKISVSFWVKTDVGNISSIFLNVEGTNFSSTGQSTLYFYTVIPGSGVVTGGLLSTSQWTHIIGTHDGNTAKLYINGVLNKSNIQNGDLNAFGANLTLGNYNQDFWAGSIDELYIYNRALSPAEVTQLYKLK